MVGLIFIILGVLCSTKTGFGLDLVTIASRTLVKNEITSLPDGYEPILNSSVAYKLYNHTEVTWIQAEERCESEGARLALPENQEVYKRLLKYQSFWGVHVGIYRKFDKWVSFRNDSALIDLPWGNDILENTGDCVVINDWIQNQKHSGSFMTEVNCDEWVAYYACEVPIPQKHTFIK